MGQEPTKLPEQRRLLRREPVELQSTGQRRNSATADWTKSQVCTYCSWSKLEDHSVYGWWGKYELTDLGHRPRRRTYSFRQGQAWIRWQTPRPTHCSHGWGLTLITWYPANQFRTYAGSGRGACRGGHTGFRNRHAVWGYFWVCVASQSNSQYW
jgi:hypothetical protein